MLGTDGSLGRQALHGFFFAPPNWSSGSYTRAYILDSFKYLVKELGDLHDTWVKNSPVELAKWQDLGSWPTLLNKSSELHPCHFHGNIASS